MTMRASQGSPASGRSLAADSPATISRNVDRPKAKGPQPKGPQKKSSGGGGIGRRQGSLVGSGGGSTGAPSSQWGLQGSSSSRLRSAYALLGSGGSSSSRTRSSSSRTAGCTVQTVAALQVGRPLHPDADGTSTKWNTDPPTSGPHYQQWAVWGAYTTPLNPAQVVHNLEHGGIFIQYGKDVPQSTVDQLKSFYDQHLNGTLLSPLPSLGDKIAMGVWTTSSPSQPNTGTAHLAKCTTFDEKAYAAFFDAYQFQGPERFPANTLTPGT